MDQSLQQLLSDLALSCHQPHLRDGYFDNVMRALDEYERLRVNHADGFAIDCCRISIFMTLWIWYDDLKISQRQRIFFRLLNFHLAIVNPSKVEFAFLVGWSHSLEFAESRNLASNSSYRHIGTELLDLCTLLPEPEVMEAFFGLGQKWTAWCHDDMRVLEMPRSYYEQHLAEHSRDIHQAILRFTEIAMKP